MGAETGQVAPDLEEKVHFNALRVLPEYRLTMELGAIEDLFQNAPGTPEGRMERLQVLGLFYFPLKHPKAKDRFPACWDWVKTKIFKAADDAAADATIQAALKCRIVSGAVPPGWNDAPMGLPPDAADPENPQHVNFAKLRLPGGYTVQHGAGAGGLNQAAGYPGMFSFNKLFEHETKFHEDNPVLRKLPLIAKVEKRENADAPWEPAPDVSVHFQLVPAYPVHIPLYKADVSSSQQFQRPPLGESRGGPTDSAAPSGSAGAGSGAIDGSLDEGSAAAPEKKSVFGTVVDAVKDAATSVASAMADGASVTIGGVTVGFKKPGFGGDDLAAPTLPSAPSLPSTPSVPSTPTLPSAPKTPKPPTPWGDSGPELPKAPTLPKPPTPWGDTPEEEEPALPPPPPKPAPGPAGAGPKKKVDVEEAGNAAPTDPQGINAHKSRGGKRGEGSLDDCSDVAGPIFHVASFPGFNDKGARELPHKPFPVAEKAVPAGELHKHAVKAKTNEDGQAGVIFESSRCSGDRYRLRAYIGPDTSPSGGSEPGAVQVTTGTFIVWRNLRVSQYFRHEISATPDAHLLADAAPAPYNIANATGYHRLVRAHNGTDFLGLETVRLDDPDGSPPSVFASLPLHFAPAFLEVEFDQAGPVTLSNADFKAALRMAVDDAKANQSKQGLSLDLDKLFFTDVDMAASDSMCNIPMRTPEAYNALVVPAKQVTMTGGTLLAAVKTKVDNLVQNYVLNGFQRSLTKDGALPGLTLIYGGMGYSWQVLLGGHFSGIVQDYRGSYLWYGAVAYRRSWDLGGTFSYDCSSNACHELGHAMFQAHGVAGGAGGPIAERHDPEADCLCVMSYGRCIGEFCGFSLLSFRGWNVP